MLGAGGMYPSSEGTVFDVPDDIRDVVSAVSESKRYLRFWNIGCTELFDLTAFLQPYNFLCIYPPLPLLKRLRIL